MIRKIIKIDEEKCNGCGLCAKACHEGAIGMAGGKAKLLRDDYCDGLGDCLPACPTGAITFEEREALSYDEAAVKANMAQNANQPPHSGCPGSNVRIIDHNDEQETLPYGCPGTHSIEIKRAQLQPDCHSKPVQTATKMPSKLSQWPVQIKLVPPGAPYLNGAKLLIAADCTAYAYGDFHEKFIKNHITLIGCPKLDDGDYTDKLTTILSNNNIKSVTVVHMEVPCCAGIANAAINALKNCGKMIPWQVVTISTDGRILD